MSNEMLMHISRLQSTKASAVIAKISMKYLSTNIEEARNVDEFYTIDFTKYGEQIIKNSTIPDDQKEEIRNRFLNKDETKDTKTEAKAPKAEAKVAKTEAKVTKTETNDTKTEAKVTKAGSNPINSTPNIVRRPRADTTKVASVQIMGAPRPIMPQRSYDDSYATAITRAPPEDDAPVAGMPARRNFRRNSTYVKRLPSQALLLA